MESEYRGIRFTDADVVNPRDYTAEGDYNPHRVRPWLLHDHGFVLAVVFASCEQDALDEAVDAGKLDRYMLDASDPQTRQDYGNSQPDGSWDWHDGVSFLGNAGEPFDIESLGMVELPTPPFSFCALLNAHNYTKCQ